MAQNDHVAANPIPVAANPIIALNPLNQIVVINAITQLPLKLTKINYSSWRVQFQSLLFEYDFEGYIDGTILCPPPTIANRDNTGTTPNPAYRLWRRQDSLLFHAMLASVFDNIVPLITSAAEAWNHLERTYASKSHTRVMGHQEILANTTTKNMSIADYMQTVKSKFETLALAASSMSDDELIHGALKGLVPSSRILLLQSLHDKLADYEMTLKRNESKSETTPITVRYNKRSNYNNKRNDSNFNTKNMTPHVGNKFQNQGNFNNRNYHGNQNYSHHSNPSFNNQFWCPQSNNHHVAKFFKSPSHPFFTPQGNFMHTTHGLTNNNIWIVDSGASHHITSDLRKLSMHYEYGGNNDIIIDTMNMMVTMISLLAMIIKFL
ncbi:hypothetical protein Pfo_018841 [Paulownia fortunei]|nr:hypothetical protein Pfo_018841 [Paulownia fortunei]